MYISNFHIIRPKFESAQENTLAWLLQAHVKSEQNSSQICIEEFASTIAEKIEKAACKKENIQKRGHILDDYLHLDDTRMQIYNLTSSPKGANITERLSLYDQTADKIFNDFYPLEATYPDELIHVSCTGYFAPSGAQKLISKKNWGSKTQVTHAYHMGCYGSIPAIRMAFGFLAAEEAKNRADIVHTEMCSLHMDPSNHKIDQLVCQSLFADGFIKYSLFKQTPLIASLKIIAILEEIIPDSQESMTWNITQHGFAMTLSKKVPLKVAQYVHPFLENLAFKAKMSVEDLKKNAIFAIHPGGPKIISYIQEIFDLSEDQIQYSQEILKNYGNMSSATLPHIWEKIVQDTTVVNNTPIVSMAFGPGLSICGNILVKTCG